jgi:hypothetical protein
VLLANAYRSKRSSVKPNRCHDVTVMYEFGSTLRQLVTCQPLLRILRWKYRERALHMPRHGRVLYFQFMSKSSFKMDLIDLSNLSSVPNL